MICLCLIASAEAESFILKKESSGQRAAVLRDEIAESYGEVAKTSSRLIQSLGGITEALIARTMDLVNGAACAVHNSNVGTLERYKQALDECEHVLNETLIYAQKVEKSLRCDAKLMADDSKRNIARNSTI